MKLWRPSIDVVRGRLERAERVTNLIAEQLHRLPLHVPARSRDFR